MTRCVGCFNCLSSCPTDAVNFEKNIPFRKPSLASPENGHGSNKTSHGSNQTAHGSNKTSHGSNQTAHGSNQTSHGSNQTAHESNQTAHGSNLTSHGNNQTAHGSKQTSNGSNQTAHGSNQTAQDNKQGTLNESKQPHARKNHAGSSEVDMNTGHQHIHDKVAGQVNLNKRRFIAGSLAYIAGMTGIAALASSDEKVNEEDLKPAQRDVPVSPPGSFSIDNFTSACTACTLCVSACPTHVLQPSFLEYGFLGIMQPRMDYIAGYCNFDCTKCSEVCPTGAISPIALKKKKTTQLGIAIFVKQNCVVETEGTDCGACAEHCPTKAVRMVPYHNNISIPEVTDDLCIGCGACEYACPLEPKYKAIYVNGNEVHQKAIEPEIEEVTEPQEPEEGTTEEFPF